MSLRHYPVVDLNAQVTVVLTPEGVGIWEHYWHSVGLPPSKVEQPVDGALTLPLWECMQVFGPHMHFGFPPPMSTKITIRTATADTSSTLVSDKAAERRRLASLANPR